MENISELSAENIQERLAEIVSEFTALNLSETSSDEDIASGEALAGEARELRSELDRRTERASVLSQVNADIEAARLPVEESVTEDVQPAEPVEPDIQQEAEETQEHEADPVPVAAATSPVQRAALNAPEVKMPRNGQSASITAAADVPNYAAGQRFDDLTAAGEAIINRARSLPTHFSANTRLRYGAVKIEKNGYGNLVQDNYHDDVELVMAAGNEKRLSGGTLALTADAWCAPSETLYDMCQYEVAAGLLSVPEFKVTRGGIRYSSGPDFSDLYSDADFYFSVSSAGVIKDGSGATVTTKPCGIVTCPPFDEIRLGVDGVCVSVDILANVGYPEMQRRVTEGVLVAHARKMNSKKITAIEQAAGAAIVVPDNSTLLFNLDILEWYGEAIRTGYSLAETHGIETVLPTWVKPLIRAELARRNGVDLVNVNDAYINSWFSNRNLSVQFVRDWQAVAGPVGAVAVPGAVKILMYPAGSWTMGTQAVISLDTIYDSALLAENKYLGLFTEEAWLMVQRCLGTTLLQMPTTVSGLSGAQITEVLGTAGV